MPLIAENVDQVENPRNHHKLVDTGVKKTNQTAVPRWRSTSAKIRLVALPGRAGTISEIALALKNGKKVILLDFDPGDVFDCYRDKGLLITASTPEKAIQLIKEFCSVA